MSRIVTQSLFHSSRTQLSWRSYLVSTGVHIASAALLLAITIPVAREQFRRPAERSVLIAPLMAPIYVAPPKLVTANIPRPKLLPPVLKLIEPKPSAVTAPPVDNIVTKSEPLPTPELKVQMPPADLAKSTPATRPVSVGRFGDSNGVPPASSKPNAVMLAKVGSFDSPNGFGQSGAGGHNQSGAVRESGFGAVSAANGRSVENGPVHTGAFNDSISAPPQNSRSKTAEVSAPMVTPVEILFKPKPAYTMEARNLRLEGQVSLQVIFLSTGSVRVVRVVHGLGHGLDEAAQQAAAQVRFKPATRGGVPVDANATINITFELT